jgi:hypothetical protein
MTRMTQIVVALACLVAISIAAVMLDVGAFAAAAANTVEAGGVSFSWEINLTTIGVFVTGALTWWLTVARQGDKVKAHAATIAYLQLELAKKVEAGTLKKLEDSVEGWKLKAIGLEAALTAFKEQVYREYLSTEAFREIKNELRDDAAGTEKRIMTSIKDLSERIDKFAQGKGARAG